METSTNVVSRAAKQEHTRLTQDRAFRYLLIILGSVASLLATGNAADILGPHGRLYFITLVGLSVLRLLWDHLQWRRYVRLIESGVLIDRDSLDEARAHLLARED